MSTADLLSQDEIDALLHGVDDGDIETSHEEDEGNIMLDPMTLIARNVLSEGACPPWKWSTNDLLDISGLHYSIFLDAPLKYPYRVYKFKNFQNLFKAYLFQLT